MVKSHSSTLLGVVREHLSSADGAYTSVAISSSLGRLATLQFCFLLRRKTVNSCRGMQYQWELWLTVGWVLVLQHSSLIIHLEFRELYDAL